MNKEKNENSIVITGTMVARAVQVLVLGFALWNIKSIDSTVLLPILCGLIATEVGLQASKKKE